MRELGPAGRGSQLLRATLGLAALLPWLGGCAPDPREVAAQRALDYLDETTDELGVDVVVAVEIYAEQRDDVRAARVARRLQAGLPPEELARYGALLGIPKPPLPRDTLDSVAPGGTVPDPSDDLGDDTVLLCLDQAMSCAIGPRCVDFLGLDDRGGYVLTHQAVFLLFAHWNGCDGALDPQRRRVLAASLAREMAAYPEPSDLALERLAMLAHLGFPDAIEGAWIDALLDSQRPSGCFEVEPGGGCHPHPTGLALWVLADDPAR